MTATATPDVSTRTLRSALIGCGKRGRFHAQALAAANRLDLVGLCDLDAERARALGRQVGCSAVETDYRRLIDEHGPQVVGFVAPPGVRASVVLPLLEMGREAGIEAIVIEKPIALELTEARRLVDAAQDAGVRLVVCHECRYADEMVGLREVIAEGRLGTLDRLAGTCRLNLLDQGTHVIDLLNCLAGERAADWVMAQVDGADELVNPGPTGHAAPAHALLQLGYGELMATATLGNHGVRTAEHADAHYLQLQLTAVGDRGVAKATLGHGLIVFTDAGREDVPSRSFDEQAYMTRGLYDELAEVVAGEKDHHPCEARFALRAQETVEAAYASSLNRRRTPLPPPGAGHATRRLKAEMITQRPIAVSTLLYAAHPRRDVLRSIAEAGYEDIDLWLYPDIAQHADPDAESADDVKRDLSEFGLTAPIASFYGARPYENRFRLAADLGAEMIVRGGINPRTQREKLDDLKAQADLCQELGVHLVLENHIHQMESIEHMQTLTDELDHPAVRLCLAPSHLALAGQRMEDALRALGDRVDLVYLWDMDFALDRTQQEAFWHDGDAQVPGANDVDFRSVLMAAARYAPQARWSMTWHGSETWPIDRVTSAIARAKRHIDRCRPTADDLTDLDLKPIALP